MDQEDGPRGRPGELPRRVRAELTPVWRAFGITPIADEEEEYGSGTRAARRRSTSSSRCRSARRPKAALDPYPDANELAYRGRPRHGGGADYEHSAYVLLVDKRGRQRVGFPFEQLSPDRLLRDIRQLKAEPS